MFNNNNNQLNNQFLFRLHKFTMVLMAKREREKKNIVINYIYIIKTARKKNNRRTATTRVNFM